MDKIRRHRVTFVKDLHSIPDLIDHLFSTGVLTRSNKTAIECRPNPHDQVRELLDILTCKGPQKLELFYNALIETDNKDLAMLMEPSLSRKIVREEIPSSVVSKEKETKQSKVLVFHGNNLQIKKKNIIKYIPFAEEETCTRIIKKIKDAGDQSFSSLVIFILGDLIGNEVEDVMSPDKKYSISEIHDTLKSLLPRKKKMCVFLHEEKNKMQIESNDTNQMLIVLGEDRLDELLKKFNEHPTDDVHSFITNFIKGDENISPLPHTHHGYILLLDGSEENKDVGDFLYKQHENRNFEYKSETCTGIERKLKSAQPSETPTYFVVFLLSQFNGSKVQDVCSGDGVHISKICVTLKEIFPQIRKICILLKEDNINRPDIGIEKGIDDLVLIVCLTNERFTQLMVKLNDSTTDTIPACIDKFVSSDEKIW